MNKQKNIENIIVATEELNIVVNQIKKQISSTGENTVIPEIEIDLALEKTRNIYNKILLLSSSIIATPTTTNAKAEIKTEPVKEKQTAPVQEPIIEKVHQELIEKKSESIIENPHIPEANIQETEQQKKTAKDTVSVDNMESLADVIFKTTKTDDFASKLQQKPIKDINEAIGLGEKLLYINELFEKNPAKFDESVKDLNNFSTLEEALNYIKSNFSWNVEKESTISFLEILKRKFSV